MLPNVCPYITTSLYKNQLYENKLEYKNTSDRENYRVDEEYPFVHEHTDSIQTDQLRICLLMISFYSTSGI